MVDPLSAESIRLDAQMPSTSRTNSISQASRLGRRTSPEFEEFGNEVLITNFDDDINDDFDLEPENTSDIHHVTGATGPSNSRVQSPNFREQSSPQFDNRQTYGEIHCKSNLDMTKQLADANEQTLSDDSEFLDDHDSQTSKSSDTYFEETRTAFSESDLLQLPLRSTVNGTTVSDAPANANKFPWEHSQEMLREANTMGTIILPSLKHSKCSTASESLFPSQLLSPCSYIQRPLSPETTTLLTPTNSSEESGEDEEYEKLQHSISNHRSPSLPELFSVRRPDSDEDIRDVPVSEPMFQAPQGRNKLSPISDTGTSVDSGTVPEKDQLSISYKAGARLESRPLRGPKQRTYQASNRSFVSSSDCFSRSEYTAFSDFSRKIDSSVEVETSDEEGSRTPELDEDALWEIENSHNIHQFKHGEKDEIGQTQANGRCANLKCS